MKSKWIEEIVECLSKKDYVGFLIVLVRIDKLLRKSMASAESETLHEEIRKELK